MKIVVALEGVHGAGKSALAGSIAALCEQHGQQCSRVGRRTGYTTAAVGRLTQLLREEARHLTPHAEIFVRVAREYQRAHLAAAAPPGVVVLDRFVLSILALARVHGCDVDLLTDVLKETAARADLRATIFVKCPYEVAWSRVEQRLQALSSTLVGGETMLRRMAEFMEEDFYRGILTGQQWLVENSKTLADANEQVAGFLLPYFRG
jgi:thymidylate kinase